MGQVASALRERPQRIVEGEGGHWRLRVQEVLPLPDEPSLAPFPHSPAASASQSLKFGYFVIFDLEATHQDATSPANEIIQIASQHFVDGQAQPPWNSFAKPLIPIPEYIIQLTKISNEEVCSAPRPISEVLRDFFAYPTSETCP